MRNKFFHQNLMRMAVIALIPLIVMGVFSITITHRYLARQNRQLSDEALLQMHESIDSIFLEISNLDAGISSNYSVQTALRRILTQPIITYEDNLILDLIASNLTAKAASNPMIHSLYIYYNNDQRQFITSDRYIAKLEGFYDGAWFDAYDPDAGSLYWGSPRKLRRDAAVEDAIVTHFRNMFFDGGTIAANLYIDEINLRLSQLVNASPQALSITDTGNRLLFYSEGYSDIPESVRGVLPEGAAENAFDERGRRYRVLRTYSKEMGLYYFSYAPQFEINDLPAQITALTLVVLVATLVVAMLFAFRIAQRSYESLHNIFRLIDASTTGNPLPEVKRDDDIYGNIASNIVRNFLQREYLMEQLSKNKYQAQALELMALQSQMNPHFLFNTLDTIYWRTIALTRKPNEATELIEWLGDILKYSLNNERSTVLIGEEIANTKNYIHIQQIRYGDHFQVIWEVGEDARRLPILKMLLQPLVENCLTHAMVKQKTLLIRVRIRRLSEEDMVRIVITDNGCGINADKLADIREKLARGCTTESHIGIFNTNKRVMLSFGERASFRIHSRVNFGTRICIEYPAVTREQGGGTESDPADVPESLPAQIAH